MFIRPRTGTLIRVQLYRERSSGGVSLNAEFTNPLVSAKWEISRKNNVIRVFVDDVEIIRHKMNNSRRLNFAPKIYSDPNPRVLTLDNLEVYTYL
jgi:hypothetical protein